MDSHPRRGVILLVAMVVLSLFTLLGMTLVLVTAQGRLSAMAAGRANPEVARSGAAMDEVFNQIVRGTRDPDSVLQAHSLLEDLYGFPQVYGSVVTVGGMGAAPVGTTSTNGQLLSLSVAAITGYNLAPASGAYVGQVITMLEGPAQGRSARIVGYAYNPSTGQGFMQISALGGMVPNASATSTSGMGDQFVVNGRPFSGTGFGYNWEWHCAPGSPNTFLTPVSNTTLLSAADPDIGLPYALLPNHAQFKSNPAFNYYDPAGPSALSAAAANGLTPPQPQYAQLLGSANEPYDAPDFQNMLLALRYYDANLGNVVTVSPSLHRPELLAYFAFWAKTNSLSNLYLGGSGVNLTLRGKTILRPEPYLEQFLPSQDLDKNGLYDYREPFIDMNGNTVYDSSEVWIDLNGDGAYTGGDLDFTGKLFNPITGPYCLNGTTFVWEKENLLLNPAPWNAYTVDWDVDNDKDGSADSIWVDFGSPVQKAADGTQYKYLAAILCEELDGKINLNAHGTTAQLDPTRYSASNISGPYMTGYFVPGKPGDPNATPPVAPVPPVPATSGPISAGSSAPIGQGYGTAEINPAYLLQYLQSGTTAVNTTGLTLFSHLLQGNASSTTPPVFTDGKYGESDRLTGYTYPGVFIPSAANNLVLTPGNLLYGGPRPGWSRWWDFYYSSLLGFTSVDDSLALARFSDFRPLLLQPNAQWSGYTVPIYNWTAAGLTAAPPFSPLSSSSPNSPYVGPGYSFDFVSSTLYPNPTPPGNLQPGATLHVPTAHGTPHDLQGRGVVAVDLRGQPYYGGTSNFPWMSTVSDPAVAATPIYAVYAPENDAVDSAYELDLSRDAQRTGRNTGDNFSGNGAFTGVTIGTAAIDAPFTPSELSGILRANDGDAAALRARLDTLTALTSPLYSFSNTMKNLTRTAVTTESWDLPVPGVLPTPLQVADIMTYNNFFSTLPIYNVSGQPAMPLTGLGVTDLARARIFAENLTLTPGFIGTPNIVPNPGMAVAPSSADLALFGAPGVWPLLSPDLVMGLRMDVNRLLGNGQDDNNNGVVDEPLEALLGEAMLFPVNTKQIPGVPPGSAPPGQPQGVWAYLDHNNDGLYPVPLSQNVFTPDPNSGNPNVGTTVSVPLPVDTFYPGAARSDTRARQLLARQLYVLMMLMIDDRFVTANIYQSTAPMPPWNTVAGAGASKEQAAYVVAQWAINAVDFRDRDSIMTPFEFDLHPFFDDDGNPANGTWDVDDIVTSRTYVSADDAATAYRGLVWGAEKPTLLMTETIAAHDRGTDNTTGDSTGQYVTTAAMPTNDTDYDQVRRPRGTIAVELFNATSPSDAPPRDLQFDSGLAGLQPWVTGNASGQGVNLLQVAYQPGAANGANPAASPVWRLAVVFSPNIDASTNKSYDDYTGLVPPNMTTKVVDPRVPVLPDAANTLGITNYIYRTAYFSPYNPLFVDPNPGPAGATQPYVNGVPAAQSFFGDPNGGVGFRMLPPNQYAIVASADAYMTTDAAGAVTPTPGTNVAYLAKNTPTSNANQNLVDLRFVNGTFTLGSDSTGMFSPTAPYGAVMSTNIKSVIGVPIQTNWLNSSNQYVQHTDGSPAGTAARTVRFSISEPPTGYPLLTGATGTATTDDGWYYKTPGSTAAGVTFPNHPWDSGQDASVKNVNPYVAPTAASGNGALITQNYTFIYLQRLANPLAVWDPFSNPYITVDRMPLDLVAYNGEYSGTDSSSPTTNEPATGYTPPETDSRTAGFDTRRRGNLGTGTAMTNAPNIWTPPLNLTTALWPTGSGDYTTPMPTASLGYLNYNTYEYGPYYTSTNAPPANATSPVPPMQYYGDPSTGPFPWLPWNDRPYVSQYELMLVPASSPSSLLSDFNMIGGITMTTGQYFPGTAVTGNLPLATFANLLNFDDSQNASTSISHLYRAFEYLHVSSRFTGTQTMLNAPLFTGANAGPTALPQPHYFHPPFNWLSRYREPGRMNLNTIMTIQDPVSKSFLPLAFEGLMDNFPGTTALWTNLLNSRQGFGTGANAPAIPNALFMYSLGTTQGMYPTFYANPFRPAGEAAFTPPLFTATGAMAPVTSMTHVWGAYTGNGVPGVLPTSPAVGTPSSDLTVNATMLRMTGTNANPSSTPSAGYGLFDDTAFDTNNSSANYTLTSGTTPYRHAGRNPYFQFQAYQRLGNLATNRSNVHAIWITLGKFQVQPVAVSDANPDGYQIIGEMGDGNGDTKRERAFYIFDRSIPVGFVRGQNLNIENGVILEQQLD